MLLTRWRTDTLSLSQSECRKFQTKWHELGEWDDIFVFEDVFENDLSDLQSVMKCV